MTGKRPSSARLRRECFEANRLEDALGVYMICHLSGARIDPARDKWEAEHPIRRVLVGHDRGLKPALVAHHKEKTKDDISENAKGKRISDKHFGVKPKGWGGKYRKKMNGEVVEK